MNKHLISTLLAIFLIFLIPSQIYSQQDEITYTATLSNGLKISIDVTVNDQGRPVVTAVNELTDESNIITAVEGYRVGFIHGCRISIPEKFREKCYPLELTMPLITEKDKTDLSTAIANSIKAYALEPKSEDAYTKATLKVEQLLGELYGKWISEYKTNSLAPVGGVPSQTSDPLGTPKPTETSIPTNTPTPTTAKQIPTIELSPPQTQYYQIDETVQVQDFTLRIQRFDMWSELSTGVLPSNDMFVVVMGTIENQSNELECIYQRDFKLKIKGQTYSVKGMSDISDIYGDDYPGSFLGQCLEPNERSTIFVSFDVSLNDSGPLSLVVGASGAIELTTVNLPQATPTPTVNQYKTTAVSIPTDELTRNTEQYLGDTVYYSGTVLQVIENQRWFSDAVVYTIRIAVNGDYDKVVVAKITYEDGKGLRPLDDDNINIWGTVEGRESFTTVLGAQVTLPMIAIDIMELN